FHFSKWEIPDSSSGADRPACAFFFVSRKYFKINFPNLIIFSFPNPGSFIQVFVLLIFYFRLYHNRYNSLRQD
ncbi:MAG: hypothetical protein ABI359_06175, partial [Ginsengibacter sp.]